MARVIVESGSGENRHITLEAVDSRSGRMREAARSLEVLKIVAMLSVLCESILCIDLHALHVVLQDEVHAPGNCVRAVDRCRASRKYLHALDHGKRDLV